MVDGWTLEAQCAPTMHSSRVTPSDSRLSQNGQSFRVAARCEIMTLLALSGILVASALLRSSRPLMRPPPQSRRALVTHCVADSSATGSVSGIVYSATTEGAPTVRLFTKAGCTLCDVAKEHLMKAASQEPHTLEAVDITDPDKRAWWQKYKYDIPVLHIDGIYWAKHRRVAPPPRWTRPARLFGLSSN